MKILLGKNSSGSEIAINLAMANRHGLISGATGTGKTVTLQLLAEGFSRQGVPVFTADVKGDLAGLSKACVLSDKLKERLTRLGIENFNPQANPCIFWDLFAEKGIPVRTTVSEVGPLLLSRILALNDTQEQVLHILFKIADDQGLLLLDLKDLKEFCSWIADNLSEIKSEYGNISPATLGTIQRSLINLEGCGGDKFFGEPALKIEHLQQYDFSGLGVVSILDSRKLLEDSRLYSTFLLWLLSELFEELPEVGDLEKPKLVFFFDEAHLLFKDAPAALVDRIERVVRLIRSKGVGVYFVTQNPLDVPATVLAQLGNRIQHALRAFTPQDQKLVKAAADTFRANPSFKTVDAITELGVGEALISVLDSFGKPTVVERVFVSCPTSKIGTIEETERLDLVNKSSLNAVYQEAIDRESAYEILKKRAQEQPQQKKEEKSEDKNTEDRESFWDSIFGSGKSKRQSTVEAMTKSTVRSIGNTIGREIVRGILGSMGVRRGR
jgi:DNA helicase HerA-like ATPase